MSLWTQPHRAPTRWGRRAGITAAVLVITVAVIVGALAVLVMGGGEADPTAGREGQGSMAGADATGASSVERKLPVAPPTGGVVLPVGTTTTGGHQVGFPHTDLGAVAAAVAITRAQVGFDYGQAATVARAYAAPDDIEVLTTRAREAVGYRRQQAGVARTGRVRAPAAFTLTPFAFQAVQLDHGCSAVTVLSLASSTTTRGRIRNTSYAGTQLVCWVDDDWRAVAGSTVDRRLLSRQPPTAVSPNVPRFRAGGWVTITAPEVSQ